MAQIQDSSTHNHLTTKPQSNTCFLGCFGFSGKVSDQKKSSPGMVKSGSRKKTRWFSWSRFRAKNSVAKTVPVDMSSEKVTTNRSKSISTDKSKVASKHHIPATAPDPSQIPAVDKPPKCTARSKTTLQNIILESCKSSGSSQTNAYRKRLSDSRKIEIQRTGVSHPGAPVDRSKSRLTATSLSHSASFPIPRHEKQPAMGKTGNSRMKSEKTHRHGHRESDTLVGKFDPVVGMSIIMVTLIIMLVWGRFCAILCTCAWFYVIPSFRTRVESRKESKLGGSDLNSEEYKKKVVLEGFLERNNRNAFGSP